MKDVGARNGWGLYDILLSPTLDTLYRARTKSLEAVTEHGPLNGFPLRAFLLSFADLQVINASLQSEMAQIFERRKSQQTERLREKLRADVKQYYEKLKTSGSNSGVLPTLSSFCKLPTVQLLQRPVLTTGKVKTLSKSLELQEMVRKDLEIWTEEAKTAFTSLLGCESWKSASKVRLHPVDRFNARFKCLGCERKGPAIGRSTNMSFAEACGHSCNRKTDKDWNARNFAPDTKVRGLRDRLPELIIAAPLCRLS